jgi:hypothetical protein
MMKKRLAAWLLIIIALPAIAEGLKSQPAPDGAAVYFIEPKDGAVIKGPLRVVFGLKGMGIAPAGIDFPGSGHHHLLINVDELPPANLPIPADDKHRHFGGGQTETELTLKPGVYTLQLLLGDRFHVPHNPPVVSEKIRITIEGPASKGKPVTL